MESWKKFQIKSREIWDVKLSYPGEGAGHEHKGFHPCIVVVFNKFANMATIIPLTGSIETLKDFPYIQILDPNSSNGLDKKSVAMIYQIRSLSIERS